MIRFALACLLALLPGTVRAQWSPFEPLSDATAPAVDNAEWSAPVDAFIFNALDDAGLTPAPAADRRVWMRRVSYDLLGLPPEPDQVQKLMLDPRPDAEAMADVVDLMLASPRYGERWARHWLDVVRYADSDGFAIDEERLSLWRYRDYVIRVLNEDRPFSEFIREQIAGDELDRGSGGKIALGFFRLGPYEADNMTGERRRQDYLNEVTTTVGNAFLGLTIGCARCHDHKFDPILQSDFYQLQAFFAPLKREMLSADFLPGEKHADIQRRYDAAVGYRLTQKKEREALRAALRRRIADHRSVPASEVSDEQLQKAIDEKQPPVTAEDADRLAELKKNAENLKPEQRFEPRVVAVGNPKDDEKAPDTFVLHNGDVFDPGEQVTPGFLSFVPVWSEELARQAADSGTNPGGRRKILAEWLTSKENPLTPRVLANRIWQYHFGAGIVATPNDFGENGSGPSHPGLLDYLARRLLADGWRLKSVHRELVLSRTYRTSSRHPDPAPCREHDPDNRLLWRSHFRRLEAETLRDAVLAVSGRLRLEAGGPGSMRHCPTGCRRLTRSLPGILLRRISGDEEASTCFCGGTWSTR